MLLSELNTSRLRLRTWKLSDFEPHVRWESDPRVNEFLPFLNAPRTPEESREWLERGLMASVEQRLKWLRKEAERPNPTWAVEVTGVADVIGAIGLALDTFEADFTPCMEIGFRFAPEYWGKGYATEAAKAVLGYGFTTMGLNEIFSMSAIGNTRSFALMERIGLRYVKNFELPTLPQGHYLRPYKLYKLTRAEWEVIPDHSPSAKVLEGGVATKVC
jgi:RimJ/RimL family protein N-acetyltransferase